MATNDPNTSSPSSRQAVYQAWAERLRRSKLEEQQAAAPAEEPVSTSSYWSPESLFRDSELMIEKEREAARKAREREEQLNEALRVLGLPPGSTLEAVSKRYRELAKQLHPDVNEPTSNATTDRLAELSAAYDLAKELLRQQAGH
jgi:DnaJ-domain-containing protein 1